MPRWVAVIVYSIAVALCSSFVLATFYPGNANVDIVAQAFQALGESPYHNWHPPVVAFVWEMLFRLTGALGSLFILQTILYALGGWLLCMLIWTRTGSLWLGASGLFLPIAPWTLSQINILWKDTQSALALLAGVLLVFFIRPQRIVSWWLFVPGAVLLVYGVSARKNAISALLPIAVFLGWLLVQTVMRNRSYRARSVNRRPSVRRWLGAASLAAASMVMFSVVSGGVVVAEKSVESARDVEDVGQVSQIMLDDVMFVLPDHELRASGAPPELIEKISSARAKCIEQGERYDAYWNCYGRGETGRVFSPIAHRDELKDLWLGMLVNHPRGYLEYRAEQYARYLTISRLLYWPSDWDEESSRVGLGVQPSGADSAVSFYVRGTNKVVPIVYLPWFWLAGGVAVCLWAAAAGRLNKGRAVPMRAEAATLAASALMYMFAYFPTIPEFHFRYTYWPAIAITAAGLMMVSGQIASIRQRRTSETNGNDEAESSGASERRVSARAV